MTLCKYVYLFISQFGGDTYHDFHTENTKKKGGEQEIWDFKTAYTLAINLCLH